MSADRSDLRAEQVEALAAVAAQALRDDDAEQTYAQSGADIAEALAPTVAALLADATAEAERQRDAVVAAVEAECATWEDVWDVGRPASAVRAIRAALAAARPAERERGGA